MTSLRIASAAALAVACTTLVEGCGGSSGISSSGSAKLAALQTQLALLEKEADRVQSAHDIRRLQRAYGYYVDQALWDDVADLFTPDGTIEIALDGVYIGQRRIREYLYELGGRH